MTAAGVFQDAERRLPLSSSCQQPARAERFSLSLSLTKCLFPSLIFHVEMINNVYNYLSFIVLVSKPKGKGSLRRPNSI